MFLFIFILLISTYILNIGLLFLKSLSFLVTKSRRKLKLAGFIVTLVSTWYGGIIGIGENTYLYGFQTWTIFGLPYYIFAIMQNVFFNSEIKLFMKHL